MTRRSVVSFGLFAMSCLVPMWAPAQTVQPPAAAPQSSSAEGSHLWLMAGAAFVTLRGDCQTCEEDFPYRHARSVVGNVGYRVNARMDVGAEVFWVPALSDANPIRTTHFDAVAQFRPWASRGFFLKGGAGMAFVRNWIDGTGGEPVNSKALSVVIGGGWVFRPASRVGVQLFAAQHAAALGDLTTATGEVPDVLGNFWSLGVGVVIR